LYVVLIVMSSGVLNLNNRYNKPNFQLTLEGLTPLFKSITLLKSPLIFKGEDDAFEYNAPYYLHKRSEFGPEFIKAKESGQKFIFFIIANNFRRNPDPTKKGVFESHACIGYWDGVRYIFFDPNGSNPKYMTSTDPKSVYTVPAFLNKDEFPEIFVGNSLYNVIHRLFQPNKGDLYYIGPITSLRGGEKTCVYRSLMFAIGLNATNGNYTKAVEYLHRKVPPMASCSNLKSLARRAFRGNGDIHGVFNALSITMKNSTIGNTVSDKNWGTNDKHKHKKRPHSANNGGKRRKTS